MKRQDRKLVWTEIRCAGCERPPYERPDGRTYLYQYSENGPLVCKPKCQDKKKDEVEK